MFAFTIYFCTQKSLSEINSEKIRWLELNYLLPLRYRKAGKLWFSGAQETYWDTCHNGVTLWKTKEFPNLPVLRS